MSDRFDALQVLTRAGEARDGLARDVAPGELVDLDARLVSDLLRQAGRVGETLATRHALVELSGVVRSIDAATSGRIELPELRRGIAMHAARTDRFAEFHDARIVLRTLDEVLGGGRDEHASVATMSQVELLGRELQDWLVAELTGGADTPTAAPAARTAVGADPRAALQIGDLQQRAAAHGIVEELLHGASHHPVTGLLGAAWIRGWSAVPIRGERLGEVEGELERLLPALEELVDDGELLQVDRRTQPSWRIEGREVVLQPALRRAWSIPLDAEGLALAATEDRGRSVLTTHDLRFAIVEGVEHHALLGPSGFVEQACAAPPLEAVAQFREHVESLADEDGEPPPDLLDVAASFGRLRRRSR